MDTISSLQNQRVKDAVALRDRRQRQRQGRIIIDGAREIRRALAAGVRPSEVFVCDSLCHSDDCHVARAELEALGTPLVFVTEKVFEKLAFGERAEGLVALAETPRRPLGALRLPPAALVVVLAGVEKPGNVGAVFRSADAVGASAVVVADAGTDLYNPNTIRASLGTVFSLPSAADGGDVVLRWLVTNGLQIVAARLDASLEYTSVDFKRPTAIVLGSEAAGLSQQWQQSHFEGTAITAVRLPMLGVSDSLNVSATAAAILYEALRQRRGAK